MDTLPLNVLRLFAFGTIFLGFDLGVVRFLPPGPGAGLPFIAVVLLLALGFLRASCFGFLLDSSASGRREECFLVEAD